MGAPTEPQATVISPHGERFEVAGRAALPPSPPGGPVLEDDWLVLKRDALFLCCDGLGNVDPAHPALGLYRSDTRFLSECRVLIDTPASMGFIRSASPGWEAEIRLSQPTEGAASLRFARRLVLGGRLFQTLRVDNLSPASTTTTIELWLGADFADIFEVRGLVVRDRRGRALHPRLEPGRATLGYIGDDSLWRQTRVGLEPPPDRIARDGGRVAAAWDLDLAGGEAFDLEVKVDCIEGAERADGSDLATTVAVVDRERTSWRQRTARVTTDDTRVNEVLEIADQDAWALMTPTDEGRIPAAGVPWYVAPFGRDSLITSLGLLPLTSAPARDTLLLLAAHQATEDEPERDAEPGKIPHELRYGEVARSGRLPQARYYGTADATPLFLIVAARYHRWTGDLETMGRLRAHLEAALGWIDRYGDRDGDGFVEYERRAERGLVNQGWKDSATALVHEDGSLATGPIALCEVQGYVYAAKKEMADVYDALGDRERAGALRVEAEQLRKAFDDAFWMPEQGTFALALDGAKRQVRSVTSNAAHCLFAGIAERGRGAEVVDRMMAPDMFSGWGLRTLSSDSPAYDPTSYHNGSVWPHDCALAAVGFKAYGCDSAAGSLGDALLDAAAAQPSFRLPELFCGFARAGPRPVSYPAACRPQAWAAVTPFLIVTTLLGLSADAPNETLVVERPRLPRRVERVELAGVEVGASRFDLRFERSGDATRVSRVRGDGSSRLVVHD